MLVRTTAAAPKASWRCLPVPAGQQELAELLVKGMYQAQPTITDGLSQLQLLQLMLLADRFGVPKDDTTCVATENTVVYTIERWWSAQDAALQHAEHLRALMHLVRMRYCTPYYSGTVMHQSSPVQQSFEHAALPLMRECCTAGGYARLQEAQCLVLHWYPAWVAEQRPASARQPVVEWRLPLASLQAPVEQLLSSGGIATVRFSDTCVVQGQPMRIKVEIKAVDTDDKAADTDRAPVLHISAFLGLRDLPAGSMRLVAATISVLPLKAAAPPSKTTGELTERLMSPERIWGFPQLVPLGTQRSWQAVKAELYRMELVHGGASAAAVPDQEHSSHLHIKVEVKQLL
ncbi:hypothetical protein OEZ86_004846 [Tetradesmus obliquus]|nr:hypothetical protein OEZ86_004846 [Tetradesmus obliquus]